MLSSSKWKCGSEKTLQTTMASVGITKVTEKPETFINAPGRCVVLL